MTAVAELDPWGLYAQGVHPVLEHADVEALRSMLDRVAAIEGDLGRVGVSDDAHRIDLLGLLERMKAVAAAAQARITVAFDRSQLSQQEESGVRREHRGRGIGDQVALARGCPTSQGSRHLGFAKAMAEMPHTPRAADPRRHQRVGRTAAGPRDRDPHARGPQGGRRATLRDDGRHHDRRGLRPAGGGVGPASGGERRSRARRRARPRGRREAGVEGGT